MAYTFETVGQPTSPWPPAARLAGGALRLLLLPVTAPARWDAHPLPARLGAAGQRGVA